MATMRENPELELEELILKRRAEGCTYPEISDELRRKFPQQRGYSSRSVRRFCEEHAIRRSSRLSQSSLKKVVATAVSQVRKLHCELSPFYFATITCLVDGTWTNEEVPSGRNSVQVTDDHPVIS